MCDTQYSSFQHRYSFPTSGPENQAKKKEKKIEKINSEVEREIFLPEGLIDYNGGYGYRRVPR